MCLLTWPIPPDMVASTCTLRNSLLLRLSYEALAWASSAGSFVRQTRLPACTAILDLSSLPICAQAGRFLSTHNHLMLTS